MQDPRNLKVWHKAREMAVVIYRYSATLPPDERFGLVSQMRRAAVSVGSNVSEGCGRLGDRELLGYLRIALGSATELEFQLLLAADLEAGDPTLRAHSLSAIGESKRMLTRLIAAIAAHTRETRKGAHRAPSTTE